MFHLEYYPANKYHRGGSTYTLFQASQPITLVDVQEIVHENPVSGTLHCQYITIFIILDTLFNILVVQDPGNILPVSFKRIMNRS